MSWTGYNTLDSLSDLVQPSSPWSSASKPLTLARVEEINFQIYSEINNSLLIESINTEEFTAADLKLLSLINDFGAGGIIDKIRYMKAQQKTAEKNQPPVNWQKMYEDKLSAFIKAKKKKARDVSRYGISSTVTNSTPCFEVNQEW